MSQDNSGNMFAGGVVVVVVVVGLCMKALHALFIEMGKTFDAFGNMAYSFFAMAWQGILMLSLIAIGAACVVGAIYFTYKYYMMVKRGTEIVKEVDAKMSDLISRTSSLMSEHREDTDSKLRRMASVISEVRAEQTRRLAPPSAPGTPAPESDQEPDSSVTESTESSPIGVSNPF